MFLMYARNILCLSLNVWLEGSFFFVLHTYLTRPIFASLWFLHSQPIFVVNDISGFQSRPVTEVQSASPNHIEASLRDVHTWGLRICSYLLWFFRMLLTYWSIWLVHPWKICASVVIWKLKFILCFIRFEGKIQCLSEPLCLMEYLLS